MNLRQLAYFLAVADEGSFSRAAASLHMTQPPLSLAIAQLEKELGVKLLRRLPHGVAPTAAGEYLSTSGRALLHHAQRIESHLKALGQGLSGQLHIAAVPTFAWAHLPPLLKAFAEFAPDVSIDLSDPSPDRVIEQVGNGQVDVGFVATSDAAQLAQLVPAGVKVQRIVLMPLLAVLPPRFSDAPEVVDLETLMGESWILPNRHPGFPGLAEQVESVWAGRGLHPREVRYVSTLQTAVPLVAAGMGVSIMPASVAELSSGHIVTRDICPQVGVLEGSMVWSELGSQKPAALRFIEMAREAGQGG
ncbi:LysR family transcriptional regulator [Micrococcales bacterium 31B]|nr:LysR family transcriptional regulator [Micrococcales bacterium 31B]